MIKVQKSIYIVFIAILIQTLLGTTLGLTMLYFSSRNHIASNVYTGSIHIGGLHREEATKKIETEYKNIIANKSFIIEYGSGKVFEVKYSDIDAVLDSTKTVESAFGMSKSDAFRNLFRGYFSSEKIHINPVIAVNEGKLREKLNELSALIDKEPVNADITISEGKIVKSQEINGLKLNIDHAVEKIKKEIGSNIAGKIIFREANDYEMETIVPQYTMYNLEGLDEIISQYTTKISNMDNADSLIQAAFAINKVYLPCADYKKGLEAASFSFNKYLLQDGGIINKNDEGYNQVASTLYAAVLKAGIDLKTVTRTPHKNSVDYIQPGLDAVVISNNFDFKFTNSLECPIMIYSEVKGDSLIVSIIGKKKDPQLNSTLETEVVQKFTPTVEYLENQDMSAGEKKMVSTGKDGVKVKVYRITSSGSENVSKQYLYEDKYEAEKAIVEIGPNTHWGEETVK